MTLAAEDEDVRTAVVPMTEIMQERLFNERQIISTPTFSVPRYRGESLKKRRLYLAVFTRNGGAEVAAVGLVIARKQTGTYEIGLEVQEFIPARHPVSVSRLKERLGRRYADAVVSGAKSPARSRRLIDALCSEDSGLAEPLNRLISKVTAEVPRGRAGHIRSHEKDAALTLLQAFDHDREFIRKAGLVSASKPFLSSLPGNSPEVDSDWLNFADWAGRDTVEYGVRIYQDGNGRELLICNLARRRAEDIDGVDLLYYNVFHQCFVLVHYADSNGDGRLVEQQLGRMKEIDDSCRPGGSSFDVRLHGKPCFIKLCDPGAFEYDSVDMLKGAYLSREHYETILCAPGVDVPGGQNERRIGGKVVPRHLNNTTFTTLLSQGWIGSSGSGTDFVRHQAQLSIEDRGSLVFGVQRGMQPVGNGIRQIRW